MIGSCHIATEPIRKGLFILGSGFLQMGREGLESAILDHQIMGADALVGLLAF